MDFSISEIRCLLFSNNNYMKRINILFLTQDYFVGGAEIVLSGLLRNMDKRRFRCIVSCYKDSGEVICLLKKYGIRIEQLSRKKDITDQLERIVRKYKIHIAYVNTYKLLNEAVILKKLSCCIIYHMHHLLNYTHSRISERKKITFLKTLYCLSDKIIACSKAVKEQFSPIGCKDIVEVVYNGSEPKIFLRSRKLPGRLRREYNIPQSEKIVAVIGRVEPQKGQRLFLKVCKRISEDCDKVKYFIIGDCASERFMKVLLGDIKRLSLIGKVILTGSRKDISEIISCVDLFLLLSVDEAFGLSLLEAMAAGTAVVATNTGGPIELIKCGKNGILVTPNNINEFSTVAVRLLKNDRERSRIGKAAQKEVSQKYTIAKQVKKIERIIEDISN